MGPWNHEKRSIQEYDEILSVKLWYSRINQDLLDWDRGQKIMTLHYQERSKHNATTAASSCSMFIPFYTYVGALMYTYVYNINIYVLYTHQGIHIPVLLFMNNYYVCLRTLVCDDSRHSWTTPSFIIRILKILNYTCLHILFCIW